MEDSDSECELITPSVEELCKPSETKLSCLYEGCKQIFKHRPALHMHLTKTHKLEGYDDHLRKNSVKRHFLCPIQACSRSVKNRSFPHLKQLRLHYQNIHGEKTLICTTCDKKFVSGSKLDLHKQRCGKVFVCNICRTPYSNKEAVSIHIWKQHGETYSPEMVVIQLPSQSSAKKISSMEVSKNTAKTGTGQDINNSKPTDASLDKVDAIAKSTSESHSRSDPEVPVTKYIRLLPKLLHVNSSTQTLHVANETTVPAVPVGEKKSISTQTNAAEELAEHHASAVRRQHMVMHTVQSGRRGKSRRRINLPRFYPHVPRTVNCDTRHQIYQPTWHELCPPHGNQMANYPGCSFHHIPHNIPYPVYARADNSEVFNNQEQNNLTTHTTAVDIGVGPCEDLDSITPSDFGTQTCLIDDAPKVISNAELGTQTSLSALIEEMTGSSSNIELQCELGNAPLQLLADSTSQTIEDFTSFGTQTNNHFLYQNNDQFATKTGNRTILTNNQFSSQTSADFSTQSNAHSENNGPFLYETNDLFATQTDDQVNNQKVNEGHIISPNISESTTEMASFGTQTAEECIDSDRQLHIPEYCMNNSTRQASTSRPVHQSTSDFAMQFPYELMNFGTQTTLPNSDFSDVSTYLFDRDPLLREGSISSGQTASLSQSSTQTDLDFLFSDIQTQTDWRL